MSEYRMKEILDEAHQQRERAERAEEAEEELRKQNEALRRRIRGMGEYVKEIEERVRRLTDGRED